MSLKSIKTRVKRLQAKITPAIPDRALLVTPHPGETDEEALASAIAEHPDGVEWARLIDEKVPVPIMYLRLN